MKVLIIGGNRFFGKRLAQLFLNSNHEVTLLNRGNLDDGFGKRVKRIQMDRTQLSKEVPELNQHWDIVYDQVCYDARDARTACEIFGKKTKKYIFTSTMSVYSNKGPNTESDFDPLIYQYAREVAKNEDYGEAKRQAEVAFTKNMSCPLISVRFPIVLGPDDYTQRLKFHVEKIAMQKPIYFPNLDAKTVFVSSEDAAKFLFFLADVDFKGPINCASREPIVLRDLIKNIEETTHHKVVLAAKGEGTESPFSFENDWFMLSERAKVLGFECKPHSAWLPALIENLERERLLTDLC